MSSEPARLLDFLPPVDAETREITGRSARLSVRETDVLGGLASGRSTEQIGDNLAMSPHTVRTHLRNIMRKLEANTRAHAVAIAIGDGAILPPQS
jgi:DNA-binding CsgD family transcriptional regulator